MGDPKGAMIWKTAHMVLQRVQAVIFGTKPRSQWSSEIKRPIDILACNAGIVAESLKFEL